MTDPLKAVVTVSDLLNERAMEQFRDRTAETQRVQAELDELDRLRATMQADTQSLGARRLAGADTMWQGWMARRRMTLQQEMAIARARQMESFSRAQTSHARLGAASDLLRQQQEARREARARKEADTLDWLSAMRSWTDQI
ncbi:hypothetical protein [Thetidibacter halocola]|uniref:Flagellar FliJ protein n=1 Tax=Thetidibacter halocola TaxID=2827239 RepID=A0A8J7WE18_9RHOB|nr:hypothetical protein [Thetidibacter halocola]MBS0123653.1 hypothetical protein [Thetidibacter halocola]